MDGELNMHFLTVLCSREKILVCYLYIPETTFDGHEGQMLWQLGVTP